MCPPGFNRRGQVFLHFGTLLAFEGLRDNESRAQRTPARRVFGASIAGASSMWKKISPQRVPVRRTATAVRLNASAASAAEAGKLLMRWKAPLRR